MAGTAWRTVTTWLARRPTVVPLLLVGAVLIGLAAGPRADDTTWIGLPDTDVIQWIVSGLLLVAIVLGAVVMALAKGQPVKEAPEQRSLLQMLSGMVLLVLFLLFLVAAGRRTGLLPGAEAPTPPPEIAGPQASPSDGGGGIQSGDGATLLVVLLISLAVLWWLRRSADPDADLDDEAAESDDGSSLEPAIARAERHLLDDNDPRTAVLLAYRQLERALEGLDLPRRDSETPTEHLARALAELSIDTPDRARPLLDLAGLYARARYAEHRITVDDQRRAATALAGARRGLTSAVTSTVASPPRPETGNTKPEPEPGP